MKKHTTTDNLAGLVSQVIDAKPGVMRAIHVFAPVLEHRRKNPTSKVPCMALRSSLHDYKLMKLYHQIECMGPSIMRELFDNPLPGTGGRGVAILFTEFPIRVWYDEKSPPLPIETGDDSKPAEILQDVLLKMDGNFEM